MRDPKINILIENQLNMHENQLKSLTSIGPGRVIGILIILALPIFKERHVFDILIILALPTSLHQQHPETVHGCAFAAFFFMKGSGQWSISSFSFRA